MSDNLINKKEALTLLQKRSQQLVGIYGDLGGESAGTTNRTSNTTESVNGASSDDMAGEDGITF